MAQLPSELLRLVFDSLMDYELVQMTQVCSHWRAVALDHPNCYQWMPLSLNSGRNAAKIFSDWNANLQKLRDTAIPIALDIRIHLSTTDLIEPLPSMEAVFRTLSAMLDLLRWLRMSCNQSIPGKALMAALCASPAPRLQYLEFEACDFACAEDIFAGSAPRLTTLHLEDTLPPRMILDAFTQIRTIRLTHIRSPDILGDLPITFPSLVELEVWNCRFRPIRSPLSLPLKHLHITEAEEFEASEALSVFETSTIPRISVAIREKLRDVSKELLVGISNAGLYLSIFTWDTALPLGEGLVPHSEIAIEDPNRQLKREITSRGLELHEIVTSFAHRLARLTITHRLLVEHLLLMEVELPQLETLTISLRRFTVSESVLFSRSRGRPKHISHIPHIFFIPPSPDGASYTILLDTPALKLLVLHDGNGLAPDCESKGTYPVVVNSSELIGLMKHMEITPRHLALKLCGVKLVGDEEDINHCLSLIRNDHV
ncbi:hypothetical protein BKA62DRAFT_721328 [Auriculariales sp. MPI-PUGE-AT-0066]|nr:hypothetical protein BKA62DRAFT_721328 [Auriculariales sp. MPI-PUGE-AT-0066]